MNRLHDEPEHIDRPSRSDWRQVLWTAAGWVALVVLTVVAWVTFKPGLCQ